MTHIRFLLPLMIVCHTAALGQGLDAYLESGAEGAYLDWEEGFVQARGRAFISRDIKRSEIYYKQTRQAAIADGQAKALSTLGRIWLDSSTRLEENQELFKRVKKLMEDGSSTQIESDTGRVFEVVTKLSLRGENGIAALVLPRASAASPRGAAPPSAAGSATGLVVDATGIGPVSTALLPRVIDENGRVVFGAETADPAVAQREGLVAYAVRAAPAQAAAAAESDVPEPSMAGVRQGRAPIVVKARSAGGTGRADLVLSVADADRVLAADAAGMFLRDCRVLVVIPAQPPPPPRPARVRQRVPPAQEAPGDPNRLP